MLRRRDALPRPPRPPRPARRPAAAAAIACAFALAACSPGYDAPPIAKVEFRAFPMIVDQCPGGLTSWQIDVRETGERWAATCDQWILISNVQPYVPYTFRITGTSGDRVCWRGECVITPLPGTNSADCSEEITDLCGGG